MSTPTVREQFLVISALGANPMELTNVLCRASHENRCAVVTSRLTRHGECSALVLQISGSWDALARLEAGLPTLAKKHDFTVNVVRSAALENRPQALPYVAYVSSAYRSDIVNELCQFFIDHNVELENLTFDTYQAPPDRRHHAQRHLYRDPAGRRADQLAARPVPGFRRCAEPGCTDRTVAPTESNVRKFFMAVVIDTPVADFEAQATSGQTFSLAGLKGKQVVLYFYPKDSTPGCTTEGQGFRDQHAAFQAANTEVFGVSRDSVKSHENFKAKQAFPFELISDKDEAVCQLFDVIKLKKLYGKEYLGVDRSTFLIDKEGVLRQEWRGVKVPGHVEAVLAAAQALHKA